MPILSFSAEVRGWRWILNLPTESHLDSFGLTHFLLGIYPVKSRFTFPAQKVPLPQSLSQVSSQRRKKRKNSLGVRWGPWTPPVSGTEQVLVGLGTGLVQFSSIWAPLVLDGPPDPSGFPWLRSLQTFRFSYSQPCLGTVPRPFNDRLRGGWLNYTYSPPRAYKTLGPFSGHLEARAGRAGLPRYLSLHCMDAEQPTRWDLLRLLSFYSSAILSSDLSLCGLGISTSCLIENAPGPGYTSASPYLSLPERCFLPPSHWARQP